MDAARDQLGEKAEELRTWYNQQSAALRQESKKLAVAAERAKAHDDRLAERETQLNAREESLAGRETALAATLQDKDEKISKLVVARTQDLEKKHRVLIETQARDYAAQLKEATDKATAATSAKAELDSQVEKLKEALDGSSREVGTLKEAALQAGRSIEELQQKVASQA